MKSKIYLILFVFLIFLVGINGVFAENIDETTDVSALSVDDADESLSAGGLSSTVNSWSDLQADSVNNNIDTIYLNGTNIAPSSNSADQIVFNHDLTIVGLDGSYVGYENWSAYTNNPNIKYSYIPFLSDSNLNIVFENVTFQYLGDNILIKVAGNGNYVFKNCVFTNINATGSHQSVLWLNSGIALLDNCTFVECNTSYGAVSNYNENSVDAVHMTVKDSTFSDNYAGVEPGCINNCGQLEVINSTFSDNYAVWWAGAIHTHIGANTIIRKSRFIDNVAGWNGGALYTYSTLSVYDSIFVGNNCTTNSGGGAIGVLAYWGQTPPTVILDNSTFINNTNVNSNGNGGVISMSGGDLTVTNNYFENNDAKNGKAIYAGSLSNVVFVNNTFVNHNGALGDNTVSLSASSFTIENNSYDNCMIKLSDFDLSADYSFSDVTTCHLKIVGLGYIDLIKSSNYSVHDGNDVFPISGADYNEATSTIDFTINTTSGSRVVYVTSDVFGETSGSITIPLEAIYVSTTGNDNYDGSSTRPVKTISKAVALAKNKGISTIVVNSGTYSISSMITITTDIHFIGLGNVVFDASSLSASYEFRVSTSQVKCSFENINLVNSKKSVFYSTSSGVKLTLINCTVRDNALTSNYLMRASSFLIENTSFINNARSIYFGSGDVINSNFINNRVTTGVLYLYGSANTFNIINSSFVNNVASSNGGAINANQFTNVYVDGCLIVNNTATNGGAIYIASRTTTSSVVIKNSIILNNGGTYAINRVNTNAALSVTANDNWWGNTARDITSSPNVNNGVTVDNWLFLSGSSVTYAEDCEFASLRLYNYYNASSIVSDVDASNLPVIDLSIYVDDGVVSDSIVSLDDGFASFYVYNVTGNIFTVNASYYDNTYSFICSVDGLKSDSYTIIHVKDIGNTATVVVNIPVNITGDVILTINGVDTILNCVNGVGTYIISNLESNLRYNIHVTYPGDSVYYGSSNSTFFMLYDDSQYSMIGYDDFNTGKSDYVGITDVCENWNVTIGEDITNAVVDGDGNVYVANGTVIYAYNNNGVLLWRYEVSGYSTFSGLAISRDVIIAPREGYKLYLINRFTGKDYSTANIWQASSLYAPIVDENANIYVSGEYQVDWGYYNLVIVPYSTWMTGDEIFTINIGNNSPTGSPIFINDELVCVNTVNGLVIVNLTSKTSQIIVNNTSDVRPVVSSNNTIYYLNSTGNIREVTVGGSIINSNNVYAGEFIALDEVNNKVYLTGSSGTAVFNMDLTVIATNQNLNFNTIVIDAEGAVYATTNNSIVKLIINGNNISEINLFYSSYNFSSIVLVDGAIYVIDNNGILHRLNEQILSNSLLNAFSKNEALLGLSLDDVMFSGMDDEILSDWATEEEDGITEWGGDLFDLFEAMGALNLGDVYGNELSYEEIEEMLYDWLIYSNFKDTITIPKGYYKRGDDYNGAFLTLFNNLLLYHYDEENDCYVYFNEDEVGDIHEYYDYRSINLYNSLSFDGNGSVIDANNFNDPYTNCLYVFNIVQDANMYPNGKTVKFNSTVKNFKFINFSSQSVLISLNDISIWDCINFVNCTFENFDSWRNNVLSRQDLGKFHFINCTFINLDCYLNCPNILFDGCTFIDCLGISATSATISNNTFYSNDFIFKIKPSNNFVFEDNYIVVNKNGEMYYGDYGAYVTEPNADSKYPYFNHVLLAGNYPLKTNITPSLEGSNLVFTLNTSDNGNLTLEDGTILKITNGKGSTPIATAPGDTIQGTISGYLGEKYYALSSDYSLTVPKLSPNLNITADDLEFEYNQPVKIAIELESQTANEANVSIYDKNGKLVDSKLTKGTATFNNLAAGEYTINVIYDEDDTFTNDSATATLTITKASPELTLDVVNTTSTLEISINTDIDEDIVVNVNGDEYKLNKDNTTFTLTNQGEGKYYVTATYGGNENYTSVSKNKTVTLSKVDADLKVKAEVADNVVTITSTLTPTTGTITYFVNNKQYTKAVGEELIIDDLTPGNYTVFASYAGDSMYNAANANDTFTISEKTKADSELKLSVEDSVITVSINSAATGDVIVTVGDISFVCDAGALAPIDVSKYLGNGTYSVSVKYVGDDNFTDASDSGSVTVPEEEVPVVELKDPNLKLDIEDTVVSVSIDSEATGDVIVTVGDISFVSDAQALAPVDVSKYLSNGTYSVSVKYVGDDNFTDAAQIGGSITIPEEDQPAKNETEPVTPEMSVKVTNTTIEVTLPKDATGNVLVDVDGQGYYAPVKDGKASVNVIGLDAGTYPVTVNYLGDDKYANATKSTSITIPDEEQPAQNETETVTPEMSVKVTNTTIEVTLPKDATGNVLVDVNGQGYYAPVKDGKASVNVIGLDAGTYPATVTYAGDDKYANATKSASVTVPEDEVPVQNETEPVTPEMSVKVTNTTVDVTLPGDATGYVLADVNGQGYYAKVTNGKASIDIVGLDAGTYPVTVDYLGDDKYANATKTASVTIPDEEQPVQNETELVTPEMSVKVTNTTIEVTLPKDATGNVLVDVNGQGYYAPVKDGKASVNVIGLDAGTYPATVKYAGDDKYANATGSARVTVPKDEDPTPEPVDSNAKVDISEDAVNVELPKDATGYVLVDVDGKGYYAPVKDGKATLDLPELDEGEHTVSVTYTGDDKYKPATANKTITVENEIATVVASNLTKVEKASDRFEAVFTDSEGNALANRDVTFELRGTTYTRTTDANGKAGMNINLIPGTYSIKTTNPVTGESVTNTITVLTRLEGSDITKYFRNGTQYRVKVLDDNGNLAKAGEVVTFNINGVFYNRTTGADGFVQLSINLLPGDYIVTAQYKGCKISNIVKVLPVLTGKDLTKKFGQSGAYEATLLDAQGKPYANQEITLNINGVLYKRTTDANGVAKLNINLQAGKYIITASYNQAVTSNTITVTA